MLEHPHTKRFLFWHALRHHIRVFLWRCIILAACCVLLIICIRLLRTPSHTREWAPDHTIAPSVELTAVGTTTLFSISNVRMTDYSKESPAPTYYKKNILLTDIQSMWYVVVPFSGFGAAHTLLSFELKDGTYISVSVEARREVEETFSPWLGVLNEYELIYVIADERDVIGRRVRVDNDPVYMYPTVASPSQAQHVFESIMRRVVTLEHYPESYDTILNNCTTNLADHINTALGDGTVPWSASLVLPKNSDSYAVSLGLLLINSTVLTEQEKERHLINEAALSSLGKPDFSKRIRNNLGDVH